MHRTFCAFSMYPYIKMHYMKLFTVAMWLALACCSRKRECVYILKQFYSCGFPQKNATAMTICTFLQFCVINISLQSFITVPVSHMKQQHGCSTCRVVFVYKFCYTGNISLGQWIFWVLTCNCCYNDIWHVKHCYIRIYSQLARTEEKFFCT
jgi:hypothetical protein